MRDGENSDMRSRGPMQHVKNNFFFIASLLLIIVFFANPVSAFESHNLEFPCDVLFPQADSFSDLEGEPLHYKVFEKQNGDDVLVGICYAVSSRGYSDDILIMVGLNDDHTLAGMRVLEQKEAIVRTIGDFMRSMSFYNQYDGKNVNEGFKVGRDIDSVTRATITNKYISTAVRDSARQFDQTYFDDNASKQTSLGKTTWNKLKDDGAISDIVVKDKNGFVVLSLSFAYVNPPMIGKNLLGTEIYSKTMQRYGGEQVFFVGINSSFGNNFGPDKVQIVQGESAVTLGFTRLSSYQQSEDGLPIQYFVITPLEGKIDFFKSEPIVINYITKSSFVSEEYDMPYKYLTEEYDASLFPLRDDESSVETESKKENTLDVLGFFSGEELANMLLVSGSLFTLSAFLIRFKKKNPKLVFRNPNYLTILTLSSIATFGILWSDSESILPLVVISLLSSSLADMGMAYFKYKKIFFPSSAIIIGLIVGLLLVPETPLYVPVLASLIAVLSKYLIKFKGRQVFNPASLGIMAVLLLFPVTLSWWGGTSFPLFVIVLGLLVLLRLKKVSHVLSFVSVYVGLALANVMITSQDFSFVTSEILSGAFLFFTFFMLTEPKTANLRNKIKVVYGMITSVFVFTIFFVTPDSFIYGLLLANLAAFFLERWYGR